MDVIKATHKTTFEVTDLPAGSRRRHRVLTEAGLAGEKRIKPARSGARPTAPWLAHVRPAPRGSDPEAPADHVVTLGRAIEVEGRRYTIEKNTAADNCWLAPIS
jgi:hypothetical protein